MRCIRIISICQIHIYLPRLVLVPKEKLQYLQRNSSVFLSRGWFLILSVLIGHAFYSISQVMVGFVGVLWCYVLDEVQNDKRGEELRYKKENGG